MLKAEVEVLARMLQRYVDNISEKRLKMMELHSSPEQVYTIANSMTVQHLNMLTSACKAFRLLLKKLALMFLFLWRIFFPLIAVGGIITWSMLGLE